MNTETFPLVRLATSVAISFLMSMSLFSTESFTINTAIILMPNSPLITSLAPNEIYEIIVPINQLKVDE